MMTAKRFAWAAGFLALAWAAGWCRAAEPKPGDLVTINKDNAEIRQGKQVIAYLSKGQRVKLHWVFKEGGYALIRYTMGGKEHYGYLSLKDFDAAPGTGAEEKAGASKMPFVVDDKLVVIAKEAKLKVGDDIVGALPEGTPLVVKKVKDNWLGVNADINGKSTFGWIHARDVDYPTLKDKEKSAPKKEPAKDKEGDKAKE